MDRGIALGRPPAPCQEAGATFQRLIDKIMEGLDFVFVYLDDILISSVDEEEHRHHLRDVFNRLHLAGLTINMRSPSSTRITSTSSASTSPRQACGPTTNTPKQSAPTRRPGTKKILPVLPALSTLSGLASLKLPNSCNN